MGFSSRDRQGFLAVYGDLLIHRKLDFSYCPVGAGCVDFEIKNQVAQPLVNGLHSSFVGLDQATIDWTIPVRDTIQVQLDIPLETDTVVVLTEPVPYRLML